MRPDEVEREIEKILLGLLKPFGDVTRGFILICLRTRLGYLKELAQDYGMNYAIRRVEML